MKIAIPLAAGQLSMHFGHCERFALVGVDSENKTILDVGYLTPPAHEPGVLPRWLHEQGANVIIASGMGQRAQGLFAQNSIKVVVGAAGGTPEEIVSAYFSKTLEIPIPDQETPTIPAFIIQEVLCNEQSSLGTAI